jgi:phosphate transport system substrate-binding protein
MWSVVTGLVMAIVAACSAPPSEQGIAPSTASGRLVVTGSSTIAPLAAELARAFESAHAGVHIDVQSGGSSRGIADARQGLADIGLVSRALKDSERDLSAFPIARDGIAMILHADNPVTTLTRAQIIGIYTGSIGNWRELGGREAPITVVNKAEGRSTLELFLQYFALNNSDIRAHTIIGDNEQAVKTVAGNANAVAYVSIGTAEYDRAQGIPIKLLPLDGVAASSQTVAQGEYPLSRVLNLITKTAPHGLQQQFIEFAQSGAAADLVAKQGFVALER